MVVVINPATEGVVERIESASAEETDAASDGSSYVTASTFLVDGGLSGAYVTPE